MPRPTGMRDIRAGTAPQQLRELLRADRRTEVGSLTLRAVLLLKVRKLFSGFHTFEMVLFSAEAAMREHPTQLASSCDGVQRAVLDLMGS